MELQSQLLRCVVRLAKICTHSVSLPLLVELKGDRLSMLFTSGRSVIEYCHDNLISESQHPKGASSNEDPAMYQAGETHEVCLKFLDLLLQLFSILFDQDPHQRVLEQLGKVNFAEFLIRDLEWAFKHRALERQHYLDTPHMSGCHHQCAHQNHAVRVVEKINKFCKSCLNLLDYTLKCTDPQDFYVLRHVVVKVLGIPLSEKARSQRLWFESIPQQDMIDHMCSTLMEQLVHLSPKVLLPSFDPSCLVRRDMEKGQLLKDRGAVEFRQQRHHVAAQLYTQALQCFPPYSENRYLCLNNRSLCEFQQGEYVRALQDSQQASTHAPFYIKSLYRSACSLRELGFQAEAFSVVMEGLNSSTEVNKDLRDLKVKILRGLDLEEPE